MVDIASGSKTAMYYKGETVRGVRPTIDGSNKAKIFRSLGRNINEQRNTLESAEIRPTGQVSESRHGFRSIVGSIPIQVGMDDYNDILRWGIRGPVWAATIATSSPNIGSTAAGFTREAGNWYDDGFRIGMVVKGAGFVTGTPIPQHLNWLVTAVSTDDGSGGTPALLTVVPFLHTTAMTVVAPAGSRGVGTSGLTTYASTTLKTFTCERQFTDLPVPLYQEFNGVAINSMAFNIVPEQIVTAQLELIGMSGTELETTSIVGANYELVDVASGLAREPFTAFDGALFIGLNFTVSNGRTTEGVIGSVFTPDIFDGTLTITGEATVFLSDATFYNDFYSELSKTMVLALRDVGGTDFMTIVFPRFKPLNANIDPPTQGPCRIVVPFQALEESGVGYSMLMQRSTTT
jgi:hypothetical protein